MNDHEEPDPPPETIPCDFIVDGEPCGRPTANGGGLCNRCLKSPNAARWIKERTTFRTPTAADLQAA